MKFDIHIHSKYSEDGIMEPEEIVRIAQKKGFDGIAITDHNSMEAYRNIRSSQIEIIKGVEVSSCCGHILAIGIQEEIKRGLSVDETIDKIKEQGGIAIAAHPYRYWSGLGEKNILNKRFDAIEILNGRSFKKDNLRAESLAKRMNLPGTGGSDAHFPYEIGKAWIEVNEDPIDAIRKNNLKVKGDSRNLMETFVYVYRSISLWAMRGFRKI
ncbi:MAG TPA: PHP domain-containing protein [Euryarchaeota archaeon]|nr:MAG: histidinol-phosphatase [Aciduliprofundum sp.]HEU12682.1 PHP domain-containing protein [Euryarchaeota archaeon]